MPNSAIADTSSLIALEKINSLNLLCKIYDTVLLPEAVFREFGASYPPCFAVKKIESPFIQFLVGDQPPGTPAPGTLHPAGSPFPISAGALIPAVLTAGINSDLPGQTTALVRRNVYDSRTGRYLLVPQGSRLVGEYDSRVAFGQSRVFVAWNRLIFPDGRSLDLGGMQGADPAAAAGLRDRVNNHFVRTFGSALLIAAVSAGVQLSQPDDDRNFQSGPTPSQLAAAAVGQELGRVATEIFAGIRIPPGCSNTAKGRPGRLPNRYCIWSGRACIRGPCHRKHLCRQKPACRKGDPNFAWRCGCVGTCSGNHPRHGTKIRLPLLARTSDLRRPQKTNPPESGFCHFNGGGGRR